ncbi:MAG TPA: sulfotransferase [Actinomycetota bacterium]|nr:sulfotransferase [Actinomycetota bacterium]
MAEHDLSGTTFAFVLGTGRCGSSLVQEVLARHPDVGFVSNVDDRLPVPGAGSTLNNSLYRRIPEALTKKGRVRYAPSEGYRALAREVSPLVVAPYRDLKASDVTPWLQKRFRAFFAVRAAAQAKPVFLHKFTGWPRVGFVQEVFPEARFVHVVRDGRAVANSFLQTSWWQGFAGPPAWGWGPLPPNYEAEWEDSERSFVLLAGLHWKMLVDAAEASLAEVPAGRSIRVRYEDFVEDPRGQLSAMLEFLGLEWNAEFQEQVDRLTFDTGRTRAYADDLTSEQVRLLDVSLGEHLARLGY